MPLSPRSTWMHDATCIASFIRMGMDLLSQGSRDMKLGVEVLPVLEAICSQGQPSAPSSIAQLVAAGFPEGKRSHSLLQPRQ